MGLFMVKSEYFTNCFIFILFTQTVTLQIF